jgi:hypothetical protein
MNNINNFENIRINCTDEQLGFAIFIINQISQFYNKSTTDVYKVLSVSGVLDDYIIGCYNSLHTLGREYLIDDITGLLNDRGFIL